MKIFVGIFFISILDEIAHNVCPEVTLNSNGSSRQLHPEIMVDYILLSVKNNGRAVYRSKEMVFKYQMHSYVYLYSFNAEEYVYIDMNENENNETIARLQNHWMVRYIEYIHVRLKHLNYLTVHSRKFKIVSSLSDFRYSQRGWLRNG